MEETIPVVVEKVTVSQDGTRQWKEETFVARSEDFVINDNALDKEACHVSQLLAYYGQLYAELQAQLERKKEHLKKVEALKSLQVRQTAEQNNKKVTEGFVDATVLVSGEYQDALAALQTTRVYAYQAEAWWRTIQRKADLLTTLNYREVAELKKL